jgi:hypothetical protein
MFLYAIVFVLFIFPFSFGYMGLYKNATLILKYGIWSKSEIFEIKLNLILSFLKFIL